MCGIAKYQHETGVPPSTLAKNLNDLYWAPD
jgi:hypothetical protein